MTTGAAATHAHQTPDQDHGSDHDIENSSSGGGPTAAHLRALRFRRGTFLLACSLFLLAFFFAVSPWPQDRCQFPHSPLLRMTLPFCSAPGSVAACARIKLFARAKSCAPRRPRIKWACGAVCFASHLNAWEASVCFLGSALPQPAFGQASGCPSRPLTTTNRLATTSFTSLLFYTLPLIFPFSMQTPTRTSVSPVCFRPRIACHLPGGRLA
jgi:hypothetical protein